MLFLQDRLAYVERIRCPDRRFYSHYSSLVDTGYLSLYIYSHFTLNQIKRWVNETFRGADSVGYDCRISVRWRSLSLNILRPMECHINLTFSDVIILLYVRSSQTLIISFVKHTYTQKVLQIFAVASLMAIRKSC